MSCSRFNNILNRHLHCPYTLGRRKKRRRKRRRRKKKKQRKKRIRGGGIIAPLSP